MAGCGPANLIADLPSPSAEERFETLARGNRTLIRRIVSTGQATAPGVWLRQHHAEWVVVLSGEAGLHLGGEDSPRRLGAGDHALIPAGLRHRVAWTAADRPTVWLAVHFD
jgi:cupin 2 domain-containing protein